MPPVGFEPTVPASEQPQAHALNRTATGMGKMFFIYATIVYFDIFALTSLCFQNTYPFQDYYLLCCDAV